MFGHERVLGVREDVTAIVSDIGEGGTTGHCDVVEVTHGRLDVVWMVVVGYIGPVWGMIGRILAMLLLVLVRMLMVLLLLLLLLLLLF